MNLYLKLLCPPMPYFVVAGKTLFRQGDVHERRVLKDIFDLIIVTRGCLYMQDGEDKYAIHENEYLVLAPNRLHYGFMPCEKDTIIYWLHFHANDKFSRVREPKMEGRKKANRKKYYRKSPFNLFVPIYNKLSEQQTRNIVHNISTLADVDVNHRLREKSFSKPQVDHLQEQQLFFNVLSNIYVKSAIDSQDGLATQIYSYLQSHYDQPFSLENMSKNFAYSKAYIIKSVKLKYNETPQQIYSHIKLENAKKLLIETSESIETVSSILGFTNPSYFIKLFKRSYGQTPLEYRKNIK